MDFVCTILRLEITPFSIICAIPCLEKALLCIICTIPCLEKALLCIICTLAFLVYGDVDFLLPSHIAFPRFVVRLVPLHHPVNLLSFWRTRLPCSEVLHILPDRFLGDVAVLIEYIKIFEAEVTQFNFRIINFEILEPIDGFSLPENVLGTQKHNVEFLQVVVYLALVQRLAIAHRLIIARPLGDFLGVFHLHFDIETAEGLATGTGFLHKDVVADSLVERAYLDCLFGFGIPKFVNLDAKHSFKEGLGDFLVAEHHGEHETVRDGELLKGYAFIFHFSVLWRERPRKGG